MAKQPRKIQLSKAQIKRISEALRAYDRRRQEVVVTATTVGTRRRTVTDNYNRTLSRYRNAFQDNQTRQEQWARWSRKDEKGRHKLPKSLDKMAREINKKKGYDEYSNYGYATVYYSYVNDSSIDVILAQMRVDIHDGDIYLHMAGR